MKTYKKHHRTCLQLSVKFWVMVQVFWMEHVVQEWVRIVEHNKCAHIHTLFSFDGEAGSVFTCTLGERGGLSEPGDDTD